MTKHHTEATLATDFRAANAGDDHAYQRFLHGIAPMVRTVVMRKTFGNTQNDNEDIVQDVLMSIHLKRHTWDCEQKVLPWVYAITRYRIVDYLRKHGRTQAQDIHINDVDEQEFAHEEHHSDRLDLAQQISKLDGRSQKVAKAMGLEGKSVQETSQECGISENAVRIAFHRAIQKLRKGL